MDGRVSRASLVIAVVEGKADRMLIYRYLKREGYEEGQIRVAQSPSGKVSAENWVRQMFVTQTQAYRSRQAATGLIVCVDADRLTVQDRLNQLDQTLKSSGKPIVGDDERIARLVPKRNIETWILCLNGQITDEETDYKNAAHDWTKMNQAAATTLCRWVHSSRNPAELHRIAAERSRRTAADSAVTATLQP